MRLPDDGYEPLPFDPRAGYIDSGEDSLVYDYASPIDAPIKSAFARRHRLEKVDPNAAFSEAVEPIIYWVDPGAPEPVKTALIEGALWWNQAFEAAGYINGFQVKVLPEDVDPMDVRYNVIQWVHRSTRGWSYGSSVRDPRTQEILKGHVTLGSLRVRQDYLIAEGLIAPYGDDDSIDEAKEKLSEFALARIRQLSAHEVGHTLVSLTISQPAQMAAPRSWIIRIRLSHSMIVVRSFLRAPTTSALVTGTSVRLSGVIRIFPTARQRKRVARPLCVKLWRQAYATSPMSMHALVIDRQPACSSSGQLVG